MELAPGKWFTGSRDRSGGRSSERGEKDFVITNWMQCVMVYDTYVLFGTFFVNKTW